MTLETFGAICDFILTYLGPPFMVVFVVFFYFMVSQIRRDWLADKKEREQQKRSENVLP